MTTTASFGRRRVSATLGIPLLFVAGTALADPQGGSDIPSADSKSTEVSVDAASTPLPDAGPVLPLPYASWQGTGFGPPKLPPTRDLPAPLARPREQARRPLEVSAALAAFLPSCGSGSIDDRGCLTLSAGSGVELAVLYRARPSFAFGMEAALSGFGRGQGLLSSSGGAARFLGVTGRVYFADAGSWDPYVALTLGVGSLDLRGADATTVTTTGLGARVAGGIDYFFGSHVRIGPSASFSRWVAYTEASCQSGICRDGGVLYGHVLGFATLGMRLSGSFGDAL